MKEISEKKKAIFESTLRLIIEHGFHGTPMSMIAKDAEVAAGTIYHYFESKDQLICELYSYNRSRTISLVRSALEEQVDYKEKFYNVWWRAQEYYNQNPGVLVFFEQYLNSPYKKSKQDDIEDRPLYDFFVEGIERGIIKDIKPKILLVIVWSNIISTAKLNIFGGAPLNKNDMDQVIDILWDGIALP